MYFTDAEAASLDRWITGNYGEDEFAEEPLDPYDDPYLDDKIDAKRDEELDDY